MCGIVGLFLKDKSLEPRTRRAAVGNAGVAVGPRSRQRRHRHLWLGRQEAQQDHHPVGRPGARFRRPRQGARREARRQGRRARQVDARRHRGAVRQARRSPRGDRGAAARRPHHGRRRRHRDLQGGRPARPGRGAFRPDGDGRHAWHRPYPHGDRIRRHHARRAPVLDRAGRMPRPQRLAVQPQQCPPRADPRGHDASRPRTTPRSPPPISRPRSRTA